MLSSLHYKQKMAGGEAGKSLAAGVFYVCGRT